METPKAVYFTDYTTCDANHVFNHRQHLNFNRDWLFKIGDHDGAERPDYPDTDWSAIGVPHSFSTPYFEEDSFYMGYGWYRKSFDLRPEWKGKHVFIDFEAVFQVAEIYLNGHHVGTHRGGYTGFEYELTPYLRPGSSVLAVRVNNQWDGTLAPRAGEHIFCGGIYRDVTLRVVAPLHVAWFGTRITTPELAEHHGKKSTVAIETEVTNHAANDAACTVRSEILSSTGAVIACATSTSRIPAGETVIVHQVSPYIVSPSLWSPHSPAMYQVRTILLNDGEAVDDYMTNFGFRWFEFTADKGFFLNGEHCWIQGANVHQDHAGWGDAVTNAAKWRDVKQVKDTGLNFIRGSHYPHDPSMADACDHLGILLWSECVFWGIGGFSECRYWKASAYPTKEQDKRPFEQSLRETLRDMIRIRRNHPSIVVWSMGNEAFFTDDSVMDEAIAAVNRMRDYAHQLDPSRPAGNGGVQRGGFDKHADVAGYNGGGEGIRDPGFPNLVSEYGSIVSDRLGQYMDLTESYDTMKVGDNPYPWRSGQVLWCAFDHGSICGRMGKMGFIDHSRLPKRSWYWYRNRFAGIAPPEWPQEEAPARIKLIADRNAVSTDGTEDVHVTVQLVNDAGCVVDAAPEVALAIVSGPGAFPTGRGITFRPEQPPVIAAGQAAISFKSYFAGVTLIRATCTGLAPAEMTLTCTGSTPYDGKTFIDWPTANRVPEELRAIGESQGWVEIARNRPAFASSEDPAYPARNATDQNATTYWQAATSDAGEWCIIDLERFSTLARIEVAFGATQHAAAIELSADNETWTPLFEPKAQVSTSHLAMDLDSVAGGRFLRIRFLQKRTDCATIRTIRAFVRS